jgi:hypothetical protein
MRLKIMKLEEAVQQSGDAFILQIWLSLLQKREPNLIDNNPRSCHHIIPQQFLQNL